MSKRLFSFAGLMVALVILLTGCSSGATTTIVVNVQTSLGKEFTLPVGQTADIQGENLFLKFVSVTADSRCPTGVQCIQAGDVRCQVQVISNGNTNTVEFFQSGGSDSATADIPGNYKAGFKVTPYPAAGTPIPAGDYKLVMTVTK